MKVSVRAVVEVLGRTEYEIVAAPDPVVGLLTVIQVGRPVMLQGQLPEVLSVMLPFPPAAVNDAVVVESEYEQDAALCVTSNERPAIVRVAARVVVAVFG